MQRGNIVREIDELKNRLTALDRERSEISDRLNVLERLPAENAVDSPAVAPRVTMTSPTSDKIALFQSLFRGREDVFPRRVLLRR